MIQRLAFFLCPKSLAPQGFFHLAGCMERAFPLFFGCKRRLMLVFPYSALPVGCMIKGAVAQLRIKKRLRRINSPCPLIHEGVYYFQLLLYNVAMNILQQIFSDHYEEIKYTLKTRPVVLESIEKMIHCGAPSFGGAMYGCPSCGALKFVRFRSHLIYRFA